MSKSYNIEIEKLHPGFKVLSQACPMWVPLVENMEIGQDGANWFVRRDIQRLLSKSTDIDAIILGCTHYPLLYQQIREAVPAHIAVINQGKIVANSLDDYLHRHPEMQQRLSQGGQIKYVTTEQPEKFCDMASIFMGQKVNAERVEL